LPKLQSRSHCGGEKRECSTDGRTGEADRAPILWVEADFLEQPILPIGVPDRPFARLRACKDRHLNPAVIVNPLNAPIAGE
jgi:hypothetical protein